MPLNSEHTMIDISIARVNGRCKCAVVAKETILEEETLRLCAAVCWRVKNDILRTGIHL